MKYNPNFLSRYGSGCDQNEIPKNVREVSDRIATRLNKKSAFFTLDFIVSNTGNVYLLEANTSPGVWWDDNFPEHVKMKKAMINIIVEEILRRVLLRNREIVNEKSLLISEKTSYLLN